MPIEIRMPAVSTDVAEASIARWLKQPGDKVTPGEILAEIETDKAVIELEATDAGVLERILAPAGTQKVAADQLIALLLAPGEKPSDATPAVSIAAAPVAAASATSVTSKAGADKASSRTARDRIFASPLAKRMAADAGIDLVTLTGSGPNGRIVEHDVAGAMAPRASTGVAQAVESKPPVVATSAMAAAYEEVPNSSMRSLIAKRLSEAKQTIPHFYLTIDCTVDALLALREEVNRDAPDNKLSLNDVVIKAIALSLKKFPAVNASWAEAAIRRYKRVAVAVAVATPSGLITPIIEDADQKGLSQISSEMKALAARAREAKLLPHEYQGGGFTISNLGMYGIREFAAIINPPQSCILAVGAAEQRPVVRNGTLGIATVMTCTLSADHRVVDGALGAEFLGSFKKLIEQPLNMLL